MWPIKSEYLQTPHAFFKGSSAVKTRRGKVRVTYISVLAFNLNCLSSYNRSGKADKLFHQLHTWESYDESVQCSW